MYLEIGSEAQTQERTGKERMKMKMSIENRKSRECKERKEDL